MTHEFHLLKGIAVLVFAATTFTAVAASAGATVNVADVEQLYAAVNDPANVGATVVLAAGIYSLSLNNPAGAPRPNGGRLELQQDMSLYGVAGDRAAVVIDASGSLSPSFTDGLPMGQRTGVIRIGRGSNAIEWLTVKGNPAAAAGIETELGEMSSTSIRVAHVVSDGSSRGVDVRNAGFAHNAGRRIDAEIVDNEFIGPTDLPQGMSEGIRLVNFVTADRGGVIVATLRGNSVHGFQFGCILANNRSSKASIQARSSGDRFFANDLGCLIAGGFSQQATGVVNADSNSTVFEAFGSEFVHNTEAPIPVGIRVAGGFSSMLTEVTSNNSVSVSLSGSKVLGNQEVDFDAFGAIHGIPASPLPGIAGRNNQVTIALRGVSARIDVVREDSMPPDPTSGNTVTVIGSPDAP